MTRPRSIDAVLAEARAAGVDRLDAHWLLGHVLGRSRSWLVAHGDAALPEDRAEALDELLGRRAAGEPFAYLVGAREFHGLTLQVDPRVLVPRPETEQLVEWALERLDALAAPRVVDLGCGSGAVALAIKQARPGAEVVATDLSPAALDVARANALHHRLSVEFRAGAWWDAVGTDRFDLVVSNPPYIAAGDPHLAALRHEPLLALSPGGDGLDALRAIVSGAHAHLRPGAWILLEHGHDQAAAVRAMLADAGCAQIETRHDLGGWPRCSGGRWP